MSILNLLVYEYYIKTFFLNLHNMCEILHLKGMLSLQPFLFLVSTFILFYLILFS